MNREEYAEFLKNKSGSFKIGELTQKVIDLLEIEDMNPRSIILTYDRIENHTLKHLQDFKDDEEFYRHISLLPEIIEKPDYVGLHPSNNSIQYIKRYTDISGDILIGIRLRKIGVLFYRSSYKITKKQFNDYLSAGTIKKFKN